MTPQPKRVVVLASDLMDRSRLTAAEVIFTRDRDSFAAALAAGSTVLAVVDLSRPGALAAAAAAVAGGVRTIGYASHVDDATLAAASDGGVEALPRSVFFRRWPDYLAGIDG